MSNSNSSSLASTSNSMLGTTAAYLALSFVFNGTAILVCLYSFLAIERKDRKRRPFPIFMFCQLLNILSQLVLLGGLVPALTIPSWQASGFTFITIAQIFIPAFNMLFIGLMDSDIISIFSIIQEEIDTRKFKPMVIYGFIIFMLPGLILTCMSSVGGVKLPFVWVAYGVTSVLWYVFCILLYDTFQSLYLIDLIYKQSRNRVEANLRWRGTIRFMTVLVCLDWLAIALALIEYFFQTSYLRSIPSALTAIHTASLPQLFQVLRVMILPVKKTVEGGVGGSPNKGVPNPSPPVLRLKLPTTTGFGSGTSDAHTSDFLTSDFLSGDFDPESQHVNNNVK